MEATFENEMPYEHSTNCLHFFGLILPLIIGDLCLIGINKLDLFLCNLPKWVPGTSEVCMKLAHLGCTNIGAPYFQSPYY